jgi:fluoride ion exporter CrcB/FEX
LWLVSRSAGRSERLSRYGADQLIEHRAVSAFPWSTFVDQRRPVLLVGFLIAAVVDRASAPDWLRLPRRRLLRRLHDVLDVRAGDLDLWRRRGRARVLNVCASVVLGVLAVLAAASARATRVTRGPPS